MRAADIVASGLTEMRGATTPRLLLELICARVLLPGVDHDSLGLGARLDRLERRVSVARSRLRWPRRDAAAARAEGQRPHPRRRSAGHAASRRTRARRTRARGPAESRQPPPAASEPAGSPRPPSQRRRGRATPQPRSPAARQAAGAVLSLADVRRIWPDLLEQVKKMRRFTWILLSQNAQVIGVDATSLTVGFKTAGARDSFVGGGSEEILRQAAIDMIGADWKIEVAVDPSAQPGPETAPRVTRPAVSQPALPDPTGRQSQAPTRTAELGQRRRAGTAEQRRGRGGRRTDPGAASASRDRIAAARSNISATRRGDEPAPASRVPISTPMPTETIPRPRTTASTAPSCSSASSGPP